MTCTDRRKRTGGHGAVALPPIVARGGVDDIRTPSRQTPVSAADVHDDYRRSDGLTADTAARLTRSSRSRGRHSDNADADFTAVAARSFAPPIRRRARRSSTAFGPAGSGLQPGATPGVADVVKCRRARRHAQSTPGRSLVALSAGASRRMGTRHREPASCARCLRRLGARWRRMHRRAPRSLVVHADTIVVDQPVAEDVASIASAYQFTAPGDGSGRSSRPAAFPRRK